MPAAVLGVGVDSRVVLVVQVPSATPMSRHRRVLVAGVGRAATFSLCVADMRVLPVSERGRENREISYFLDFE